MAYVSNNLEEITDGYFQYITQDNISDVLASGYFSDFASTKSGSVGDYIIISDGTYDCVGLANRFTLEVVGLSGNAAICEIVGGRSKPTKTLTAATTLTGADSGFDLYLDADTEFATTLPDPVAGFNCRIIVADAPSGADYTVVTTDSDNIIAGHITSADLDATVDGGAATAADTITFADGAAVKGDFVDIRCDGTSYYVHGSCDAVTGITLTQAS